MAGDIKIGSYTGTGAAVTIDCGFVPDYVKVWNATDGDETWEWFWGMTAGHALYVRNSVDSGSTGNNSMSRITSNGISPDEGTLASPKGITFGTAISESGDTFRYVALRNSDY